jgi:hypothetical protein
VCRFSGQKCIYNHFGKFSAEYIGALDAEFKEFPNMIFFLFLDSLINGSYIFEGFANKTTSRDGLISIRLGIPPLFDVSYILNADAENIINSLVSLLKKDGYQSLFSMAGQIISATLVAQRIRYSLTNIIAKMITMINLRTLAVERI